MTVHQAADERLAEVGSNIADDYMTLKLLAAGLARILWERQRVREGAEPTTGLLPQAWRTGVTRLWWRALEQGSNPPVSDMEVFAWCRLPLGCWPVRLDVSDSDAESLLIDGEELSAFADEAARLAPRSDVEAELTENRAFAKLQVAAELHGRTEEEVQQAYVALRLFLIETPVVSDLELNKLTGRFREVDRHGRLYVRDFFDAAYQYRKTGGSASCRVCSDCGNPLHEGVEMCGTPGCTGVPVIRQLKVLEGYYVQHRGVRVCMHDPGLVEKRLFDALRHLPEGRARLHKWPGMDACDVAVEFRDPAAPDDPNRSEWWAGDAKDCTSATMLGRSFKWDQRMRARYRFLILPQHRFEQKHYVDDLKREMQGRSDGVRVISEGDFVSKARARALGGTPW
ncbi:hypothetical protein ABT300_23750 [Streptomyces sp. NPDC001027]|uniref:restriction endonuclease-related protein n=1 Tax=Streptomyces sp. NPDC001027 TaxID=3154771 RepID=UPI0033333060